MSKLTIYDISKLAGVSIATVSRVLNGSGNVNADTRKKVEQIVKQYQYVPQQSARNFTQKTPSVIGLLVDDVRHAYMSELSYAIVKQLAEWDLHAILCNIDNVDEEFISTIDSLLAKKVSGIILLGSIFEVPICKVSIERRYSAVPFVAVNANFILPNVCEIMQDHVQGICSAVKYLYNQGRHKIGYIFYNRSKSDHRKRIGFLEGTKHCGLQGDRIILTQYRTPEAGRRATAQLLSQFPDIDAIIFSSDILAVGGTHLLNTMGISIPNQIAVIGFNNSQCARDCFPALSSVDNRIPESGKIAAEMMAKILSNKEVDNKMLKCALVLRQSTEGKEIERICEPHEKA